MIDQPQKPVEVPQIRDLFAATLRAAAPGVATQILPEHVILAVSSEGSHRAQAMLEAAGVTPRRIRQALDQHEKTSLKATVSVREIVGEKDWADTIRQVPFSPEAKAVMIHCFTLSAHSDQPGRDLFDVALLTAASSASGRKLLEGLGADVDSLRSSLLSDLPATVGNAFEAAPSIEPASD